MSHTNIHGARRYRYGIHGDPARRRATQEQFRQRRERANRAAPVPFDVTRVCSTDNLQRTFQALRRDGGPGAGPDGITYDDLGRSEAFAVCRDLADRIRNGRYRPSEARIVEESKPDGGTRELRLRSIADRAVAKAVADELTPVIDPQFLPTSHGFRPGRGVEHMLARTAAAIIGGGQTVLAIDDVRKAFDQVRIEPLRELVAQYVPDKPMRKLIGVILRGGDRPQDRRVGIDQGSALSPLMLNVQLHHALDTPFAADATLPVLERYADNLCAACLTTDEAEAAIARMSELLTSAGHALKGVGGGIYDLQTGQAAELLGYEITLADGWVRFRATSQSSEGLRERLALAWETSSPLDTARSVLANWINLLGPVPQEETDHVIHTLRHTADEVRLSEAVDCGALQRTWEKARQRWTRLLAQAMTVYADLRSVT